LRARASSMAAVAVFPGESSPTASVRGPGVPGAPAVPPPPTRLERARPIVVPVLVALAAKVAVVALAYAMLQRPDDFWHRMAWNWDGEHYLRIARDGYQFRGEGEGDSVAFAGLYPLLIRIAGGSATAALAINNVCSLAAVAVIAWHWGPRPAMAVALFPAWLVYGSVAYSEGLFVLLAAVALAGIERGRQALGGLAGAAAAFARYMGGPALLLAAVPWRSWRQPREWLGFGLVAASGVAIFGFLWSWTGEVFGYYEAQRPWAAELVWPWEHFDWLLTGWFTLQGGAIQSGNLSPIDFVVRDVLHGTPVFLGVLLLVRERRLPSAIYSGLLFALALCTIGTPGVSFPRYLVAAFPAIAAVGARMRDPWLWGGYAVVAIALAAGGLSHHLFRFWS
jgi:hypothetical protein